MLYEVITGHVAAGGPEGLATPCHNPGRTVGLGHSSAKGASGCRSAGYPGVRVHGAGTAGELAKETAQKVFV